MKFVAFGICVLAALVTLTNFSTAADFQATWNSSSGNWSDPTRWSTNPNIPNNGASTYDVTVSGGTATLDLNVVIEDFTLNGGTLNGAFGLTANDAVTWSGGTMSGSGETTIASGGSMALSGNGRLSRSLVNNGSTSWASNADWVLSNGTFTNNGTFTANLAGRSNIAPSGPGANAFNNAGTFLKQGVAEADLFVPVNNSGTVDVQAGSLRFLGSLVNDQAGQFQVGDGATLNVQGTANFGPTARITGLGTILFANGTADFHGANSIDTYAAAKTIVSNGALSFEFDENISALTLENSVFQHATFVDVNDTLLVKGGTFRGNGRTDANAYHTIDGSLRIDQSHTLRSAGRGNCDAKSDHHHGSGRTVGRNY